MRNNKDCDDHANDNQPQDDIRDDLAGGVKLLGVDITLLEYGEGLFKKEKTMSTRLNNPRAWAVAVVSSVLWLAAPALGDAEASKVLS